MAGIQAGKKDKIIPLPVRFIKNHEFSQIQAVYKNREIKESVLDYNQSRMHPIILETTIKKKSKRINRSTNRKNGPTTLCLTQKRSRRREKNIKQVDQIENKL